MSLCVLVSLLVMLNDKYEKKDNLQQIIIDNNLFNKSFNLAINVLDYIEQYINRHKHI